MAVGGPVSSCHLVANVAKLPQPLQHSQHRHSTTSRAAGGDGDCQVAMVAARWWQVAMASARWAHLSLMHFACKTACITDIVRKTSSFTGKMPPGSKLSSFCGCTAGHNRMISKLNHRQQLQPIRRPTPSKVRHRQMAVTSAKGHIDGAVNPELAPSPTTTASSP